MGLDNHIESVIKGILKNPILVVLKEINIVKILKQSNFVTLGTNFYNALKNGDRLNKNPKELNSY